MAVEVCLVEHWRVTGLGLVIEICEGHWGIVVRILPVLIDEVSTFDLRTWRCDTVNRGQRSAQSAIIHGQGLKLVRWQVVMGSLIGETTWVWVLALMRGRAQGEMTLSILCMRRCCPVWSWVAALVHHAAVIASSVLQIVGRAWNLILVRLWVKQTVLAWHVRIVSFNIDCLSLSLKQLISLNFNLLAHFCDLVF